MAQITCYDYLLRAEVVQQHFRVRQIFVIILVVCVCYCCYVYYTVFCVKVKGFCVFFTL